MPLLRSVIVSILAIVSPSGAFSQSSSTRIAGVAEPPELTGEPKKVSQPTEDDVQFFKLLGNKNDDQIKGALPQLSEFIKQHPNYSNAYFLRATLTSCKSDSPDYASISNDVKTAMSNPGSSMYNATDYYSLLGKLDLAAAKYEQAISDLEKAMSRDLSSADKMFNIGGVEPKKESDFCTWNLTDLDSLIAKAPKDYRPWLFRGLYYEFFTTFGEEYYSKALSQFQHAALLNPRSPLPAYFIGELSSKASFWTKKAWASDAGRDNITKNAVQAYTKAIQLDPKFLPAYEKRASGYVNLKDYPQAIKDYDKVLALDPNNDTAFSDRGIAKLETKQYFAAISDFGDSIRLKGEGHSFLPELYENRGDARVGLGQYRDAISDYSKSIERRLANDSFLFSLKQFRALYPEYDQVPDETLIRKLNALFWPEFEYSAYAHQLEQNGNWAVTFLLVDLYQKRGDAYLDDGDYRRGVLDFNRIYKGIPDFTSSTDRWRVLGADASGKQYFLDVKSAEFPTNGPVHLWIKAIGKKETNTVADDFDCKSKRMRSTSIVTYDLDGKVIRNSDLVDEWQRIIPDTVGERFFNGACSQGRQSQGE